MRKTGPVMAILMLLAACDRSYGRLPQGGIAGLDGTYRGEATLTLGRTNCPREVAYAMTVRNGTVYGEIFNPRNPNAAPTRFEALIDAEAKIGVKARAGGDETLVEGFFDFDRFLGTTKSENCTNRLTLRRVNS